MIFVADGQSIYQLSTWSGRSDAVVWIGLVAIWSFTAKWRHPVVAQGEDPDRVQRLGRKRSLLLAVGLVAAAVLWPVLGFFFLLDFGCDFATC
ncbi:hypothetical protein [Streptomyces griseorubiginosus]|uniref:Uncharacterized protein n=1 Tax=Streptomyces griseorubiginosus TaxID=67304 RepID=A0A101RYX8_9ACTN|nr:hypothetical protein [Streptomyces griseorubiginosus]AYC42999.1 hypothetical protein DWG14_07305 [Streptomyces griseorubiginosus]KUN64253.1 hypothetical protein AQJ54_24835 [Streptomyces griseorubiginosus]